MNAIVLPLKKGSLMRYHILPILYLAFVATAVRAQDPPGGETKVQTPDLYVMELTEFRIKSPSEEKPTNRDIVEGFTKLAEQGTIEPTAKIRMTVVFGIENTVQFERTELTLRKTPERQTRHPSERPNYTSLIFTPIRTDGKIELRMRYESAQSNGDATEDLPSSMQINTAIVNEQMEIGKPCLLSAKFPSDTLHLIATIKR
jgi:hypothetical protein